MNACVPNNCKYIDRFNGLAIISFFTCICMWHVNVVSVFVSEMYFDSNWTRIVVIWRKFSDFGSCQWRNKCEQDRTSCNPPTTANNRNHWVCVCLFTCVETPCVLTYCCEWMCVNIFHFIIADRPFITNCRWVGRRRVQIVSHRWMCACLCMNLVVNYYSLLRW